jgi:hypothetical protein
MPNISTASPTVRPPVRNGETNSTPAMTDKHLAGFLTCFYGRVFPGTARYLLKERWAALERRSKRWCLEVQRSRSNTNSPYLDWSQGQDTKAFLITGLTTV